MLYCIHTKKLSCLKSGVEFDMNHILYEYKELTPFLRQLNFSGVNAVINFRSCSKNSIEKQDGRFVAMVTKDLQTLNLKFDQSMFNSLVLTWERNLVFQTKVI